MQRLVEIMAFLSRYAGMPRSETRALSMTQMGMWMDATADLVTREFGSSA